MRVPNYPKLLVPTIQALEQFGNSGSNSEILNKIIQILDLPDKVVNQSHKGYESMTELAYQAAWALTLWQQKGFREI